MLLLLFVLLHPIYMSYTEIRLNEDREEYELLMKVFTDDLEKALSAYHKTEVEIYTDREHVNADSLILAYIDHTVQLSDTSIINLTYLGREYKRNEFFMTYLYFTFPKSKASMLSLTSSFLTEIYQDQLNIITFISAGNVEKYTLTKHDKSIKLIK